MFKLAGIGYFMMLGYLAKKYEIPRRIGNMILEGVSLTGAAFSEGMGRQIATGMIPDDVPPLPQSSPDRPLP